MISLNRRAAFLIFVVASLYAFIWIAAQANADLDTQDVFWYFNRAQLYWRGDFEGIKQYNPLYPLLIGGVNVFIGQIMLSAVLFNTVLFGVFCVGVYWLLTHYYNRQIALIALLILATHIYFIWFLRQMQTMLLFVTLLVWCWITITHFVNRPTYRHAFLMGCMVTLAVFTRLEAIYYGIFLFIACMVVLFRTAQLRRSIALFITSVLPLAITLPLYLLRIFTSELAGGESLFLALQATSTPMAFMAQSIFDDISLVISFWFVGLWLLTIFALTRHNTPFRRSSLLFVGIFLYHISVLFISTQTTVVGSLLYFLSMFIYSSFLIAWGIWLLGQWLSMQRLVWAVVAIIMFIHLYTALQTEKLSPLFAFTTDTYAQDAQAMDTWLRDNDLDGKKIYTLCYNVLGYTSNPMHYIYRYGTSANTPNQWDAPQNLLPRMVEQDALFMECGTILFDEWKVFLAGDMHIAPNTFEYIGTPTQNYRFYRAIREN